MSEYLELNVDKFTFKVAVDRLYTADGFWVLAQDNLIRIGLSDFLQQRSGDIAFADVQPKGTMLKAGDEAATIETIKVNIDLNSPVAGTIVRVNPLMETAPETINQDPSGEGWVFEIEAVDWTADRRTLLEPAAYFARMKQEVESENQ